jgi:hypothetical protein
MHCRQFLFGLIDGEEEGMQRLIAEKQLGCGLGGVTVGSL